MGELIIDKTESPDGGQRRARMEGGQNGTSSYQRLWSIW
jgi:hypothetical protein